MGPPPGLGYASPKGRRVAVDEAGVGLKAGIGTPLRPRYFGVICGPPLGGYTGLWNNRVLAAFPRVEVARCKCSISCGLDCGSGSLPIS